MRAWVSITLTILVLAGLGLGFTVAFRASGGLELMADEEQQPVLLLVVGNRDNVDAVRGALREQPVLYTSADAFALESGHIVAARVDAASDPLNELGWSTRPLEIIDPRRLRPPPKRRLDPRTNPPDGGKSLAELARQPTLTPGEAVRALRMLR